MEAVGLAVLGTTLIGVIGAVAWRRRRQRRLPVTSRSVRCPLHDDQATVTVRIDPAAHTHRQHVAVTTCSLLSDAAIALPDRTAYLADGPPFRMLLGTASPYPVYTDLSCPQHCVAVLNQAAPSVAPRPLECASGASDAIDLVRQAVRNPRVSQLLWYGV